MPTWRAIYWLGAGAALGVGVIAIASIGLPFVILGLSLVGIGVARMRGSAWWAALVGFGGVPTAVLVWDVTSMPWACMSASGGESSLPNVNYFSCVDTFAGRVTSYHVAAAVFAAIALAGIVLGVLSTVRRRRRDAVA